MATTSKSPGEVIDRTAAVKSVLASFGMEGLNPDRATTALLEQYGAGSISLEELGAAIERHVAHMTTKEDAA
jgi:phage tail tape-measure protein